MTDAQLAERAGRFREGTRKRYEKGETEGDMWFFELYHFLGDVQKALSPASQLSAGER